MERNEQFGPVIGVSAHCQGRADGIQRFPIVILRLFIAVTVCQLFVLVRRVSLVRNSCEGGHFERAQELVSPVMGRRARHFVVNRITPLQKCVHLSVIPNDRAAIRLVFKKEISKKELIKKF